MTKLTQKRRAARKKRLDRARYLHVVGCVVCDGWQKAIVVAEYTGVDFKVGEIRSAGGSVWWRYDGRDSCGDPIWTIVDCSELVR